ncbi:helix-turn-helix domain-containing protein [Chitinispirillales bacterium ANBcel5]|uniref:helix-turn-helix domain-containing protein n=1 Tax=Cellulosispirillum alkaliphilum TaxID=3039283 RepID=UPI002A520427|nr:helix-turn-helix domain-containing protein [Chitinispirillales bacterium ANBcel5]
MVLKEPACTIAVEVLCEEIKHVEFSASYFPYGSEEAQTTSLGLIDRPPFKMIWNTQNIPNQYFVGATLFAEGTTEDGDVEVVSFEGVFPFHNRFDYDFNLIPFAYTGSSRGPENALPFEMPISMSASAWFHWNEKELVVSVEVRDPAFYSNSSKNFRHNNGVEIMFDVGNRKLPYPDHNTLFYFVPIDGSPYKVNYQPQYSQDGEFRITTHTESIDYSYKLKKREFNGYTVMLSIPAEAFGDEIPDTLGANVVLKITGEDGDQQNISLVPGSAYQIYSPAFWDRLYIQPKPLLMNRFVLWAIYFLIGLLLTFLGYAVHYLLRKPQMVKKFERSEEELEQFETLRSVISDELTNKTLSIEYVSKLVGVSVSKINAIIKTHTGHTFSSYLMQCRVEIARERLRSSRSSEASIAEQCGFKDVNEMEKYFVKFYHTTPYKFRSEQQVA